MAVVAAAHEIGVQRVDGAGHAVDGVDGARRGDQRLGEHLATEDPAMRHPLAAADEHHRGELTEVGLVVAGHSFVTDPGLTELLQVQDLQQVGDRVTGGRVQRAHTC